MALQTFSPSVAPSPGTSRKPEVKVLVASFGDGYSQAAPDGLNHIRRTLTLFWEKLTPTQADAIDTFLTTHGGVTPFYYTPSDEDDPVKWVCREWDQRTGKSGFREFNAVLRQDFSLVT